MAGSAQRARRWLGAAALVAAMLVVTSTAAQEPPPAQAAPAQAAPDHFAKGTAALGTGRFEDAIVELEAFADRMPPHPDASYNRGLAYLMRVRHSAEKPGDLGRAAAAFEEALAMRPGDADAARAVELVQGEVARRRARRGKDVVLARPSLDRVVVRLLSERSWGIAAVIASLILAAGLVLRRREGNPHVAGVVMVPLGAVLMLLFAPLYLGARHLRLNRGAGVLVVREAYLSDETGARLGGEAIPEAAKVETGERRGRLLEVRYGSVEGWLPADTVRVLRTR